MKLKSAVALIVAVVPALSFAQGRSPEATATLAEVSKTLGAVPAMVSEMPDENVAPFWEQMKVLQLNPATALSGKAKELIALGVAAQIPCAYCVHGHTEFARLNGATQREMREAIAAAGLARELSAIANGPEAPKSDAAVAPEVAATYKEIDKAFGGSGPAFFKRYPPASIVSLWKQVKAVTVNPNGANSVKLKTLISLAVATQLPSVQCVKDYTMMARGNGATEQEIQEAVAIAGLVRSASTVLNGSMLDHAEWKRQIDTIVKHVSGAGAKKSASR